MFANPEVWQFPYGRAFSQDETSASLKLQLEECESCGFGGWIAVERETSRIIGYVGISVRTFLPEILPAVEVGWRFDPAVWGRGCTSEGARRAFTTLERNEVCSVPQADSPTSSRVCERIGMRLERTAVIPGNSRRGALKAFL